jgi:hypothetical protein
MAHAARQLNSRRRSAPLRYIGLSVLFVSWPRRILTPRYTPFYMAMGKKNKKGGSLYEKIIH